MKKRAALAAVVVILCVLLIAVVKNIQNNNSSSNARVSKTSNEAALKQNTGTEKVNDSTEVPKSTSEAASQGTDKKSSGEAAKTTVSEKSSGSKGAVVNSSDKASMPIQKTQPDSKATKVQENSTPNFIVTDAVNGKTILSVYVSPNGESAAKFTMSALNANKISYKASGIGDAVYFSMIGGFKERGAGPASGWCYFINGTKPSVSAGSYTMKSGDKIEWKYLKDGTVD